MGEQAVAAVGHHHELSEPDDLQKEMVQEIRSVVASCL
jgi:hypothetical protein